MTSYSLYFRISRYALIACLFWLHPVTAKSASTTLSPASGPPELANIKAESAILVDAKTGKVLFARNEEQPRPIASTQKLLTALLVAEEGDLDGRFTIEEADTLAEPTKLGFKTGEVYSRRDLLTVLLVHSCNDAALALARNNAGSVEAFADKMNRRAFVLGANHSHFVNPNGLPADDQYSTASDLSKIALAVHENPTLGEIVSIKYLNFDYPDGRKIFYKNTNRALREQPFCTGMKTGYTVKSKHCLVLSGTYQDRDVIAVVLGCKKAQAVNEGVALLCYGLNIPYQSPATLDEETVPVVKKKSTSTRQRRKASH
ncbi:MAG: D-alanyl-D-alanine carboxypeptidase family protein [Chthoniobacterales bacterium]